MKKLYILSILAVSMIFAGCGNFTDSSSDLGTSVTKATAVTTTAPVTDDAKTTTVVSTGISLPDSETTGAETETGVIGSDVSEVTAESTAQETTTQSVTTTSKETTTTVKPTTTTKKTTTTVKPTTTTKKTTTTVKPTTTTKKTTTTVKPTTTTKKTTTTVKPTTTTKPITTTTTGNNLSESEVYKKLIEMKSVYPDGMTWTNDNFYAWNGGIYAGGYGCAGFAFAVSDNAFGSLPARMHTDFSNIKVGDILRLYYDSHSVIVLEVNGTVLTVAEGNINESVMWGRKINIANEDGLTHVLTRYP